MELSVQKLYNRWAKIALAILMLLSLFHFETVWAQSDKKPQFIEMQKWINEQNQMKGGRLLNAPFSQPSTQIQDTILMIQNMLIRLIDDPNFDKNTIVHLYSSPTPNAWVHNLGEETVLKKYKQFNNPGPVYEIGVTTGLLNILKYQDELAFILGHELTHLIEKHTDDHGENERFEKWIASQSNEVVADLGGLEKMKGKYELSGALSAMLRILKRNVPQLETDAPFVVASKVIQAGIGSHHAEGQRISTIQIAIEHLRRSNRDAAPIKMIEMPEPIRVAKTSAPDLSHQESIAKEVEDLLAQEKMFEISKNKNVKLKNSELINYSFGLELSDLNIILNSLEKSNASTQKKMDLLLLILLRASQSTGDFGTKIFEYAKLHLKDPNRIKNNPDLQTYIKLKKAFVKNLKNWDSEIILTELRKKITYNPKESYINWNFELEKLLNTEPSLTDLFIDLTKSSDKWSSFVDQVYNYDILTDLTAEGLEKRIFGIYAKSSLIDHLINNPSEFEKRFIKAISKLNPADLAKQDHIRFNMLIMQINNPIFVSLKGKKVLAYRKVLQSSIQHFIHVVFYEINKISNPEKLLNYTSRMMRSRDSLLNSSQLFNLNKIELAAFKKMENTANANLEITLKNLETILNGKNFSEKEKWIFLDNYLLGTNEIIEKTVQHQANLLIRQLTPHAMMSKILDSHLDLVQLAFEGAKIVNQHNTTYKKLSISGLSEEEYNKAMNGAQAQKKLLKYTRFYLSKLIEFHSDWLNTNFQYKDLKKLISRFEVYFIFQRSIRSDDTHLPDNLIHFLLEVLERQNPERIQLKDWLHSYKRILNLSMPGYFILQKTQLKLSHFIYAHMKTMDPKEFENLVDKKSVWKTLTTEQMTEIYTNKFLRTNQSNLKNLPVLSQNLMKMFETTGLQKDRLDVVRLIKQKITEILNIQPQELSLMQLEDKRSNTEKASDLAFEIRYLSALVELIQNQKPVEQIAFIEYLLGREMAIPAIASDLQKIINESFRGKFQIEPALRSLRSELNIRNPLERAFITNSFLAGSQSLLERPSDFDIFKSHILKNIEPKNQDLAKEMLNALIEAEGHNKSFILAYIISQKSEGSEGLSEALVLKSLLDAYGAPGVKLAQYLAFSGSFKAYQPVLEKYQDAAMPITYYDAIQLLQSRMGSEWDGNRFRVNKIIGSGSVNIAIEIEDRITKQPRVVSILREHIEVKTQEDFRRFGLLINALTKTPELQEKYAFVTGLLDIIQKSVTLEFNKKNSFEMQKMAEKVYNQNVGEWKVRTVQAEQLTDSSVIMRKAIGRSARKVLHENPKAYQQAVSALLQVEYAAMRGVLEPGQTAPKTFFSNPDIHDGQMLIDIETKTVTLLDFGQAITINSIEREFALDILRMINNLESSRNSIQILSRWANSLGATEFKVSIDRMNEVLKKPERMDRFVHLLSELDRAGFDVPLSTIHWVLSANRLIILGEKSGVNIEKSFGHLLVSRKLGLPLEAYNTVRNLKEKIRSEQPVLNSPQIIRCEMLFTK